MEHQQLSLALIPHEIDGALINQRAVDGYINATSMCKAVGKLFNDYSRLKTTAEYLAALESDTGIPVSQLVISLKGNTRGYEQGTWVHPEVAINLAQWLSPKFAVAVSRWVKEWFTDGYKARMPYHLRRYMANRSDIPHTHFSMLNEMMFGLVGPLEADGYTLPEDMLPDISMGRIFSKWLRDDKGIDTESLPTYDHRYEDGRVFPARLYPNSVLADFRRHFNEEWLPKKAAAYFQKRDPKALEFLPKLLPEVQFKQMIVEETTGEDVPVTPKEAAKTFAQIRKALEE